MNFNRKLYRQIIKNDLPRGVFGDEALKAAHEMRRAVYDLPWWSWSRITASWMRWAFNTATYDERLDKLLIARAKRGMDSYVTGKGSNKYSAGHNYDEVVQTLTESKEWAARARVTISELGLSQEKEKKILRGTLVRETGIIAEKLAKHTELGLTTQQVLENAERLKYLYGKGIDLYTQGIASPSETDRAEAKKALAADREFATARLKASKALASALAIELRRADVAATPDIAQKLIDLLNTDELSKKLGGKDREFVVGIRDQIIEKLRSSSTSAEMGPILEKITGILSVYDGKEKLSKEEVQFVASARGAIIKKIRDTSSSEQHNISLQSVLIAFVAANLDSAKKEAQAFANDAILAMLANHPAVEVMESTYKFQGSKTESRVLEIDFNMLFDSLGKDFEHPLIKAIWEKYYPMLERSYKEGEVDPNDIMQANLSEREIGDQTQRFKIALAVNPNTRFPEILASHTSDMYEERILNGYMPYNNELEGSERIRDALVARQAVQHADKVQLIECDFNPDSKTMHNIRKITQQRGYFELDIPYIQPSLAPGDDPSPQHLVVKVPERMLNADGTIKDESKKELLVEVRKLLDGYFEDIQADWNRQAREANEEAGRAVWVEKDENGLKEFPETRRALGGLIQAVAANPATEIFSQKHPPIKLPANGVAKVIRSMLDFRRDERHDEKSKLLEERASEIVDKITKGDAFRKAVGEKWSDFVGHSKNAIDAHKTHTGIA